MSTYFAAGVAGVLTMVNVGLFFGWASPSLPLLLRDDSPVTLTRAESSWVVSIFTIGGAIGSIICNYIPDILGRKNSLLLSLIPGLVSWLILGFASTVWELYISRFICGICIGIALTVIPMFFGEIAPPHTRGFVATFMTIAVKVGALLGYAMGPFLSIRDFALISAAMPVLSFLSLFWVPESPYHLLRKGHYDAARESLAKYRGTKEISREMDIIEKAIKLDLSSDTGFREMFCVVGNRKSLIIVVLVTQVQQWCGSQVIIQYSQSIFDEAKTNLNGQYLTIILGVVQVVCALICLVIIDRKGRKPLLIVSMLGTACCMLTVGVYFFLRHVRVDTSQLTWIPAVGAMLFILMYSVGLAGVPGTLLSEMFPTNVKSMASSITVTLSSVSAFVLMFTFQAISKQFGIYTAFWIYAASSIVGTVFTRIYVPETKGKTLLEIQNQIHGRTTN